MWPRAAKGQSLGKGAVAHCPAATLHARQLVMGRERPGVQRGETLIAAAMLLRAASRVRVVQDVGHLPM